MATKFYVRLRTALTHDEGATAVEYGLLVSLIAVVVIAGITAFGSRLNTVFTNIVGSF